jgi:apolipoprotein N-acyltransferase
LNERHTLSQDRFRLALAIGSGLLLAAAFPKFGVAGLAWAAPGVMLAAAAGVKSRAAFRLGFIAGLVHHLVSLSWLLNIPVMKIAPITGWLALSGYLALYQALWVWLCWKMFPSRIAVPESGGGLMSLLDQFLASGWSQRLRWTLACAALWTAGEMVQARLLSGLPWNFLGASQFEMLPVIQIASVTGVYGVSFLMAWFAVSLLCAAAVVLRRSESPRRWMGEIILPLLALAGVVMTGFPHLLQHKPETARLRIALVQPSIPQKMIWAPGENQQRFEQLLALSEKALTNAPATNRPALMVWPEAAVPGFVRFDTNIHHAITHFVRRHGIWLVLGADDAAPRRDADDPFAHDSFNASFLVGPDGEFRASYRKRRLVMFGEYLPFARWLPFLERWTGMGSFTEGNEAVPFAVPELGFKTSVLICFEDVFPHLVCNDVQDDTDFLLNLTNNGWFGESAAQWQHAANAVFRAVENGLPLVRCANNGLTCVVSPHGGINDAFFPGTTDAYGAGFKIVEVPLLAGTRRTRTFYGEHGDVFGWSCVAWSALVLGLGALRKR